MNEVTMLWKPIVSFCIFFLVEIRFLVVLWSKVHFWPKQSCVFFMPSLNTSKGVFHVPIQRNPFWANTQVTRATTSVFLQNMRWRHSHSWGETTYRFPTKYRLTLSSVKTIHVFIIWRRALDTDKLDLPTTGFFLLPLMWSV